MPPRRPAPPRETALSVLRRARELGIDHIDTAQFYGGGAVNTLIREALHPYGTDLAIVTKVGAREDPDRGLIAAQRPEELRAQVHENLRTLGAQRIEVVNLRRLDEPPGILAQGDQLVDLDSQLAELIALREEGAIGAIGLSNVSVDQLRHALTAGIACVQNMYSLLDRHSDPVLGLCREHGIAFVPYCPLGSAFPEWPKVVEDPQVIAAAAQTGMTPAQVGLAWLLARAPNVLLIPGTGSVSHLEENVRAAGIPLPAEVADRLARV